MNIMKQEATEDKFYYNLLTVNYSKMSLEAITAMSYYAFENGIEIEDYLNNYKGHKKLSMLKTYLNLIEIYHAKIQ